MLINIQLQIHTKCEENLEITDDYAIKLYDKLKSYFNKLNFKLICVNNQIKNEIYEDKKRIII
jgi:hypothetical protein